MNIFGQLTLTLAVMRHEHRARVALERDDMAIAFQEAFAFYRLAPDNPHANFLLAQTYIDSAKHREAIPLLEQVVTCWPEDAASWYALGVCWDYLDNSSAAMEAYHRTLMLAPHWLVALKHWGRCAWKCGQKDLAWKCLQRYCTEVADDKEAHDLLGYLAFEQGYLRQSFSHYIQASRLDPLNPQLDRNARVLYRRSALS